WPAVSHPSCRSANVRHRLPVPRPGSAAVEPVSHARLARRSASQSISRQRTAAVAPFLTNTDLNLKELLMLGRVGSVCLVLIGVLASAAAAAEPTWKAGAAAEKITPESPMWMAGYGARNHPATGLLNDLWARALVLEDPRGQKVALVSLDLVGI